MLPELLSYFHYLNLRNGSQLWGNSGLEDQVRDPVS